jgi:hypothetical protein
VSMALARAGAPEWSSPNVVSISDYKRGGSPLDRGFPSTSAGGRPIVPGVASQVAVNIIVQHFSGRSPMRILCVVGLMAGVVFTLAASTRPSVAVIIYPWCANYEWWPKLRFHIAAAVRVDPRRQWGLLRSESLLPAVSTAADVCAAYPAMTSHPVARL